MLITDDVTKEDLEVINIQIENKKAQNSKLKNSVLNSYMVLNTILRRLDMKQVKDVNSIYDLDIGTLTSKLSEIKTWNE